MEASFNPNMPFKWNASRIQVLPNQRAGAGPPTNEPPPRMTQPPPNARMPPSSSSNQVNPTATPNTMAFGGGPHKHMGNQRNESGFQRDSGRDHGGGGTPGGHSRDRGLGNAGPMSGPRGNRNNSSPMTAGGRMDKPDPVPRGPDRDRGGRRGGDDRGDRSGGNAR